MILDDIINFLEKKYSTELAEKWDNSGLIVGRKENNISGITICLDVTIDVIDQAVAERTELIISHHPLIFSDIKRITSETLLGKKILELLENKISVYSMHTNVDSAANGLNDYILEKLSLGGIKSIWLANDKDPESGLGRILELDQEMSVNELSKQIKKRLNLKNIRIAGSESKKVKKIAVLTGAGGSLISEIDKSIDLYITGDLKHHETLDALEEGLTLIDLGHFESENIFSELIKRELTGFFNGKIIQARENQIFKII
jgi:dinuclear metal center YbgI/SA1388 family protein